MFMSMAVSVFLFLSTFMPCPFPGNTGMGMDMDMDVEMDMDIINIDGNMAVKMDISEEKNVLDGSDIRFVRYRNRPNYRYRDWSAI
jgi:hypothetical protein